MMIPRHTYTTRITFVILTIYLVVNFIEYGDYAKRHFLEMRRFLRTSWFHLNFMSMMTRTRGSNAAANKYLQPHENHRHLEYIEPSISPLHVPYLNQIEEGGSQDPMTPHDITSTHYDRSTRKTMLMNTTPPPKTISTTLQGDDESHGNMFDVRALKRITIEGISIYTRNTDEVSYDVWSKNGRFRGCETNASCWTLVASGNVTGCGNSSFTPLPLESFSPLSVDASQTRAFYVTLMTDGILSGRGGVRGVGSVYEGNEDIEIMEGVSVTLHPSGSILKHRPWRGSLHYSTRELDVIMTPYPDESSITLSVPSTAPSSRPFESPTSRPSIRSPHVTPPTLPMTAVSDVEVIKPKTTTAPTLERVVDTFVYYFEVPNFPVPDESFHVINSSVRNFLGMYMEDEFNILHTLGKTNMPLVDSVTSENDYEQSLVSTIVTVKRDNTISTGEVRFVLLYYSSSLAKKINAAFIGPRVEMTTQPISLVGHDLEKITSTNKRVFERQIHTYLDLIVDSEYLKILSVTIDDQVLVYNSTSLLSSVSSLDLTLIILAELYPPPSVNITQVFLYSFAEYKRKFIEQLHQFQEFSHISDVKVEKPSNMPTNDRPVNETLEIKSTDVTEPNNNNNTKRKILLPMTNIWLFSFVVGAAISCFVVLIYLIYKKKKRAKSFVVDPRMGGIKRMSTCMIPAATLAPMDSLSSLFGVDRRGSDWSDAIPRRGSAA